MSFWATTKVGGIHVNSAYKSEFIRQNLEVQNNVIQKSYAFCVKRKALFKTVHNYQF